MKRTKRVTIVVTEKEYQYIQRRADLEKRSMSNHVWFMYRKGVNSESEERGAGTNEEVGEGTSEEVESSSEAYGIYASFLDSLPRPEERD